MTVIISPNRPTTNGYSTGDHSSYNGVNQPSNGYRDPTYPSDTTTTDYPSEYGREQPNTSRSTQDSSQITHHQMNRRSRKMSDDECDPFAHEDREYRNSASHIGNPAAAGPQAPAQREWAGSHAHVQKASNGGMRAGPTHVAAQKVTYDKSTARPRPRPQQQQQEQPRGAALRLNSIESTRLAAEGAEEGGNQW